MTDFGLTRELEPWERPKGRVPFNGGRPLSEPFQQRAEPLDDDANPRYDGVSPSGASHMMPGYVSRYLGGSVGGGGFDQDEIPRYDDDGGCCGGGGRGLGWRSDTPDTQFTAGTSSTRSSMRPKIAFGRRVPDVVPKRAGSTASTNLSYSRPSTAARCVNVLYLCVHIRTCISHIYIYACVRVCVQKL